MLLKLAMTGKCCYGYSVDVVWPALQFMEQKIIFLKALQVWQVFYMRVYQDDYNL